MAGSASTITYDDGHDRKGRQSNINRIIIDWTSDDTTGAVTVTTGKIVGTLMRVVTDPGSPAPSANYDITISDSDGIDVLIGGGGTGGTDASLANRHTSNTESVVLVAEDSVTNPIPGSQPVVCSTLSVAVTNAGNSKQGQIIIYYMT